MVGPGGSRGDVMQEGPWQDLASSALTLSTWELGAQHNRHLWTAKKARDCVLFTSVPPRTWLTGALSG